MPKCILKICMSFLKWQVNNYPAEVRRCWIIPATRNHIFFLSCIWITLIYASSSSTWSVLEDKGSWLTPRPGWISNDFKSSLVLSKEDPKAARLHPWLQTVQHLEKWLEMRKDCAIIQNRRRNTMFSPWCKAILRAGGKNSMRPFIF